jgi:Polysaccharide lyase
VKISGLDNLRLTGTVTLAFLQGSNVVVGRGGWGVPHIRREIVAVGVAIVVVIALASATGSAQTAQVTVTSSIKTGASLRGQVPWSAEVSGVVPSPASISRVVFSINGVEQWTERVPPYVYEGEQGALDTRRLLTGQHTLTVRAFLTNGSVATDSVVVTAAEGVKRLYSNFEEPGAIGPPFSALEYRGSFEKGIPRERQLAWVKSPVRRGSHALRFTVQPGDRYGESTGERALLRNTDLVNFEGADVYFAWSSLFPPDWMAPPGWAIFFELHGDSRYQLAPIRLNAQGNSVRLDMTTGACGGKSLCAYHRNHPVLSTLSKGRWNDFVLHIRYSKTNRGLVEICHRVSGGKQKQKPWRMVRSIRRVPTLPYHPGQGDATVYFLWGLYTGVGDSTRVVYGDNFTFSTKLADVAAAFPQKRPTCKFTPAN